MSTYPNSNVFIVKVQNQTYLAFLLNQDGTRIKFFGSEEIISKGELHSYIQSKYNKRPDWIKCMRGSNPFQQGSVSMRSQMWGGGSTQTSIRDEIDRAVGQKPSDDYRDYDSDNDGYMSSWKEKRVLSQRMEKQMAEYESRASSYPSFESYHSVTDYEICEVMTWLAGKDKPPRQSENYGGVLNF